MKNSVLIFFLSFISVYSFSQDLIKTNFGQKINCKITGEDSVRIYFIVIENNDPMSTSIKKSSVKDVKYEAGPSIFASQPNILYNHYNCITVGVLEGGGGLVGVDLEFKLSDRLAFQAGASLVGFGCGVNLHFKPTLRSSFISLQYWHQGVKDSFYQSLLGPSFVYRAKNIFTAQLGFGFTVENGPAWPEDKEPMPVMLTYAVGFYFPW